MINTNSSEEEIRYDLKQAIQTRDFQTLLQTHGEGTDLMSVMPDMVREIADLAFEILVADVLKAWLMLQLFCAFWYFQRMIFIMKFFWKISPPKTNSSLMNEKVQGYSSNSSQVHY